MLGAPRVAFWMTAEEFMLRLPVYILELIKSSKG
jgi:hypothetical protein